MVRKRNRLKKIFTDKSGLTIVNVMVAFVILLLCAAMFEQALKISMRFADKASNVRKNLQEAVEHYYTSEPDNYQSMSLSFQSSEGAGSFNLSLKKASTDENGITLYYYKYEQ